MGGFGMRSGRCGSTGRLSEEGCRSSTGVGICGAWGGCDCASDKRYVRRTELFEDACYLPVWPFFWRDDIFLHACLRLIAVVLVLITLHMVYS